MKNQRFVISLMFLFFIEILTLLVFCVKKNDSSLDAVAVNEVVQTIQNNWERLSSPSPPEAIQLPQNARNHQKPGEYQNPTDLDYVVLDLDGDVLFETAPGLSENIHDAVVHRDTILDLEINGLNVGKVIIYNNSAEFLRTQRRNATILFSAVLFVQCCISVWYLFFLNRRVIRPFRKLKGFAERVAAGNLDIPLEMDRENLFGAFTESFDIMRSELKKARIAEAEATASKKELVAKLSHDIKTPVASIKAASEVGAALTEKISAETDISSPLLAQISGNYTQIVRKADQINTLITNLFTATLEELRQLSVIPVDMASSELKLIFENADYLQRASAPAVPDCLLYADRLRLQQVFDNLFANSYKYADTNIDLRVVKTDRCLSVSIEDCGGGVKAEELPLLKEKFKRGSNAKAIEGAGLGLYISDYFMKEMHGELMIENGRNGLKATVRIALSGHSI